MNRTAFGVWMSRRSAARRAREEEHHAHEAGCTALCCARSGQTMRVVTLANAPCEAACLRDLGMVEGVEVAVLREGDPLLVKVGDARFGIGRAAAMNVLCHECEDDCELRGICERER